ncbi:signal peptidase I [Candidatus Falkowbacteria bacterium CG10_big_fil_rev_8_21_14_0_10_44_15]|uniref:Signal peptidase I n=1 Tax=Candidatus Falkowbacteria bacterium CG10_big_fil_rev_8_21_14_0_10_44_15 TaxID=1974569 RepID=A0A2H0V0H0_9BACT|nr:MAG: signal peptidase I [Candidatus Falkowbacteria bacterium CG10_big_fil_rev_8_21_14_0_10_44_15]
MKKFFIFGVIAVVIIGAIFYFSGQNNFDLSCVTEEAEQIVRGQSLSGLIEEGQTIKMLKGFYNCNPVRRGDVIVYGYSGQPEPIIKIAQGLPGDSFSLAKNHRGNYNIVINGQAAKNSAGQSYELPEGRQQMLALYSNDYQGVIPANAYLILGNQTEGSLDSTRFGLIGKEGIMGKVEANR